MQIIFYNNDYPDIKVNKILGNPLATISDSKALEGTSSFYKPILRVKNLPIYRASNFIYIDYYNAYYFVEDKGDETGGFLLLYLKIDPLMTCRVAINNSIGHITRSSQGSKWTPDPLCIIGDKSTWNHETIGEFAQEGNVFVIVKGGI